MLGRIKSSFKHSFQLLSFQNSKKLSLTSLATYSSTLHKPKDQNQVKISPFKNYNSKSNKSQKIIPNKDLGVIKENIVKRSAIDGILHRSLEECKQIIESTELTTNFDKKQLDILISELWDCYQGIRKISRSHTESSSSMINNFYNMSYIPDSIIKDKDILRLFEEVVTKITEVYKVNEHQAISEPHSFASVVKCCARFEKFHQTSEFWNIVYKVVQSFIREEYPPTQAELNYMSSFLKSLSCHKDYCRQQANVGANTKYAHERLVEVETVSKKLFDYLMMSKDRLNLRSRISIMIEFHANKDNFLNLLSDQTADMLKSFDDFSEDVPLCLAKVAPLRELPEFSSIFELLKKLSIRYAMNNEMNNSKILLIIKALTEGTPNCKKDEFAVLWSNLTYNFKQKTNEKLDILDIAKLMSYLFANKQYSDEKFWFLQEYAIWAYNNSNNSKGSKVISNILEEDDQNLEETSLPKDQNTEKIKMKRLVKGSLEILGHLGNKNVVKAINDDLVKHILRSIEENRNNVSKEEFGKVFISCGMVLEKVDNSGHNKGPILKELKKFLSKLNDEFMKYIDEAKGEELAMGFQSFCFQGNINSEIYETFRKGISSKLSGLSAISCLQILQGINQLKKTNNSQEVDTGALELVVINRLTAALNSLTPVNFKKYFLLTKGLQNLTHSKQLEAELRSYILSQIRLFSLKDIALVLSQFRSGLSLSPDFLIKIAPYVIENLPQADINDLFDIIISYINYNVIVPGLLDGLEFALLKEIKYHLRNKTFKSHKDLPNLIEIFEILTKSSFENQNLIEVFEILFKLHLTELSFTETVQVFDGLMMYSSRNINLIKDFLTVINQMLQSESDKKNLKKPENNKVLKPFYHAMITLGLDYQAQINLQDYEEINKMVQSIDNEHNNLRERRLTAFDYHSQIKQELTNMKVDLEENFSVKGFVVDYFIKPKTLVEVYGPLHYMGESRKLLLRNQRKVRLLEKLGYKVVIIPYFEWNEAIEENKSRITYIDEKIGLSCI